TGMEYLQAQRSAAQTEALRQAEAFAEIQTRITDATRQILSTLGTLPAIQEQNWDQTTEILKAVHARNPDYLNFTVLDSRGIVTASSLLAAGIDLFERPHVQAAIQTGGFSSGEFLIGMIEDTPSFAFSLPVYDNNGDLVAIINTLYKLSSYAELFQTFNLPKDSFLGIVDRKGLRLYFYPPKETNPIGAPIVPRVWKKLLEGPDRGMFSDVSSDGASRYFGYKKLRLDPEQEPYMYVVYAVPQEAITRASRNIIFHYLGIMALASLITLFLAFRLSRLFFGSRLSRIIAMAEEIQRGNLSSRIHLEGDTSDLGHIAGALDNMAEAVEKRDKMLLEEAEALSVSLKEKEVLLKEVHHRVKNNLQLILSLIRLQTEFPLSPEEEKKVLEARVNAISLVHEMLYQSESLSKIELGDYTENLVSLIHSLHDNKHNIQTQVSVEKIYCQIDRAVPFGLLCDELVVNAFKHGLKNTENGRLTVTLIRSDGAVSLRVRDNGPGLPEGFSLAQGSGLGLQLADSLAAQIDGTLRWESDKGAHFIVEFPLAE
ncbi:MAG: hypothetical protein JW760_09295, partial [Spirochaetales bacterium]|nr:hypothetical protein [Spirochaetales bacterium]